MKKADRIASFVKELGTDPGLSHDPCYQGYFACFNEQKYYDAHDVLEHLWLSHRDDNHLFFKGLIQIAGAFVHLQKQFEAPDHPKHGRRLRPAVRLFHLGIRNISPYGPHHMGLDVEALCRMCEGEAASIISSDFTRNPWHPSTAPRLLLGE